MAAKKAAPKKELPVQSLAELGLENYKMVEVTRDHLKNAEYNPRVITDTERRKLKAGLQRHGLVSPIVYNVRTGNICGGHQRISVMDSITGTRNYRLNVAQIDVDLTREKEINILLNNPNAQGAWDLTKLSDLVMDKELNLDGTGFDRTDLFRLLGEDYDTGQDAETLGELANKVREASKLYNDIQSKNGDKGREDFYLVVIFRDAADRAEFLERHHLDDNRYQSGDDFRRLCGEDSEHNVEVGVQAAESAVDVVVKPARKRKL